MTKYHIFLLLTSLFFVKKTICQTPVAAYIGNSGKETFYDVTEISNGTVLVCGYLENFDWVPSNVPISALSYSGNIPNSQGSNRYGVILHLSHDLQTLIRIVHFPQGAVEDIRFMKFNSLPYSPTGDLFISCNTSDSDNNNGGYIIAKLNNNFVQGYPTSVSNFAVVWAKSVAKETHPWDVSSNNLIYYVSGEAHGYDWSAMYSLDENFSRRVVENWRTHWLNNGSEFRGTPASSNPNGGITQVKYSGIVFKIWGRCELRSWSWEDFNSIHPDGNGGTRKGKWPADILFNSPCDPQNPTATGPGYTGYSAEACCPVWGASSITVDKRNGDVYLGMNFKSYSNPFESPDYEPAVIAFDESGSVKWWSRLYHEITPTGDTVESLPDQYVDALAIDYANDKLVVGARAHGNNTENLWEGNTIAINPAAYGFQNQFTGINGDIHESWLGKFNLTNGVLTNATYLAEMTDATGSFGVPHPDPNLDGWPNPNSGWVNLNSTRISKNALKVTSSGEVCITATGRRTITTANAYQKMVKPFYGGVSAWNSFVRVYDSEFHVPKYSSLIVGVWDTLTSIGGSNTEIYGMHKTSDGIYAIGKQTTDGTGTPNGNPIPVTNVPNWASNLPAGESGIIVFYPADNIDNPSDGYSNVLANKGSSDDRRIFSIYPNPATNQLNISLSKGSGNSSFYYTIYSVEGKKLSSGISENNAQINLTNFSNGIYSLIINHEGTIIREKIIVIGDSINK